MFYAILNPSVEGYPICNWEKRVCLPMQKKKMIPDLNFRPPSFHSTSRFWIVLQHTMLKDHFLSKMYIFYIQPTLICRNQVTLVSDFSIVFSWEKSRFWLKLYFLDKIWSNGAVCTVSWKRDFQWLKQCVWMHIESSEKI